jgi:hypothetical protein
VVSGPGSVVVVTAAEVVVVGTAVDVVLVDDAIDEMSAPVLVVRFSAPVHAPINATKKTAKTERLIRRPPERALELGAWALPVGLAGFLTRIT